MSKIKYLAVGLLTVLASIAGGLIAQSISTPPAAAPAKLPVVPAFRFTERNGQPITPNELAGNVWIASFVFTRCSGTCPAVAATLARLQKDLADVPNARIVTFTIDPERDTPDELKKYAERYQADPQRWLFVTGAEDEIHALANQTFKMLVKKNANPKPGDEFDHGTRLFVVDAVGQIRGVFDGLPPRAGEPDAFEKNLAELKTMVRDLAKR